MTQKELWMLERILEEFDAGRESAKQGRIEKEVGKSTLLQVDADRHYDKARSGIKSLLGVNR
jgi:hypothetical protein